MNKFIQLVNERFGKQYTNYDELYNWSVENIEDFWALIWEVGGIIASKPYEQVVLNFDDMFNSEWFPGARLNFAENLLRFRDERTAIVFKGEDAEPCYITYAQLGAHLGSGWHHRQ
ncbi:MAG: hypothetical protein M1551_09120 [Firmicutes bacterium]|nr:hypothetical protein [Bacillota bacterium]